MKNSQEKKVWDAVVIGGGPSGMMAAGRAAERGAKVLILEKNKGLGKKLLITGGGRCNMTNAELDNRKLLSKFKNSDKYLFSAFSKWSVKETLCFFHNKGLLTKVEAEKRVFPVTDKAESVWEVLVNNLNYNGVTIRTNTEVKNIIKEGGRVIGVELKNGEVIFGKNFILATGGKSHPETGSTGEGFLWLEHMGHKIIEPKSSLVPIALKDKWIKKVAGIILQPVKITIYQNNNKQTFKTGRVLFTHFGISGPTVINLSSEIAELLKYGKIELFLDLFPDLDPGALNEKLQELFKKESNKKFKNGMTTLLPSSFVSVLSELSNIDGGKWLHSVTREERLDLIKLLKAIPLNIKGLLGEDKSIVTSGGVALEEVDFKTMRSKLYQNLYLIGDVLNIDRPSGGYSLQLCWTTGFVAGDSISFN